MPRRIPSEVHIQIVELAPCGTHVKVLAKTFGVSEASICAWRKQDQIDRGELDGLSTDQAVELAAARRRIKQLETEPRELRRIWLAGEILEAHKDSGGTYGATPSRPSRFTAAASTSVTTRSS